ncbi:MAG: YidC/Oxa1 family membrane protein insertase [Lachnospiraceae bacterium]|nr:YidC/Oxa1 family membrane protein insertase [Lachnospiraceae bacterium]
MTDIVLTQYSGKILGPIARFLGWIMNGIYTVFSNAFGIENIALSIIVFTILIYLCLFPLTYKQQKFSKLSQKMQPEMQAIQKKYANKKDQASMMAMQEETQQLYEKYGISPTGSCLQAFIQMPIWFALYRVFVNVPAYVSSVKGVFADLTNGIMNTSGYKDVMTKLTQTYNLGIPTDFTVKDKSALYNYVVDVLYKLPTEGWETLKDKFSGLENLIDTTHESVSEFNYFIGMNISDTPIAIIKSSFTEHAYLIVIAAILIPVLSYATQILNLKLMPQAGGDNDQMAKQMNMMNKTMPLFMMIMCFFTPVGLGIYWIAGALCRSVQQFFLNKHMEKINLDDIIEKNQEKAKKKREKMGIADRQIVNNARMSTKSNTNLSSATKEEKEEKLRKAVEYTKNANPNSMAAKANMVREFNERNNK